MTTYKNLKTGRVYRENNGSVEYMINGNWYSSVMYSPNLLDDKSKFEKISD